MDIVDTKTADHLMKLMRKVVGARCVLTGIRPRHGRHEALVVTTPTDRYHPGDARRLAWGGAALVLLIACRGRGVDATRAPGPAPLRTIVIEHPLERWSRDHFVEMAPTVRVSIAPGGGAETRVFLRVPDGAPITIRSRETPSLVFPPGTESDRVSFVIGAGEARRIDDVRGTRWDDRGVEYFHVYLPRDDRPDADLVGVEWRRGDADEERRATDWLVAWAGSHRAPPDGEPMDDGELDRFRRLNHCQNCHVADKPEATSDDDRLPPWPTDGRGLYAPLAVLSPRAILSTTSDFDDPNAGDAFMKMRCGPDAARLHGRPGAHWFTCDAGLPVGERDLAAAMNAADAYASRTCAARRYLVSRMDAAARAVYDPLLEACARR